MLYSGKFSRGSIFTDGQSLPLIFAGLIFADARDHNHAGFIFTDSSLNHENWTPQTIAIAN